MWFPSSNFLPLYKWITYYHESSFLYLTLTIATKKKEYTMFATLRGFDCVLLCVIFCYSFSLLVGLPKDNMKRALQIGIAAVMAGTSTYILMINDEAYRHTHTHRPHRIPFTGTVLRLTWLFHSSFQCLRILDIRLKQQK